MFDKQRMYANILLSKAAPVNVDRRGPIDQLLSSDDDSLAGCGKHMAYNKVNHRNLT